MAVIPTMRRTPERLWTRGLRKKWRNLALRFQASNFFLTGRGKKVNNLHRSFASFKLIRRVSFLTKQNSLFSRIFLATNLKGCKNMANNRLSLRDIHLIPCVNPRSFMFLLSKPSPLFKHGLYTLLILWLL